MLGGSALEGIDVDSNTTRSLAAYMARGWQIVPLHDVAAGYCSCRKGPECSNAGKHPLYENWSKLHLLPSTIEHVYQQRPTSNIGIATGRPSRVFALDYDPHNGADMGELIGAVGVLPQTWTQRTGSGGRHWLFTMPDDFEPTNSPGRLPRGFDIRGTGGQIVVAPSVTGKGSYEHDGGDLVAAPPLALLDLIRPAAYEPRQKTSSFSVRDTDDRGRAYALAGMRAECAKLAGEHHTRNAVAYVVACRLHELVNAGWLDFEEAESAYIAAAEQASSNKAEPFPESEARHVWANAAMKVGDEPALLPPSALGGERLDFSQGSMAAPMSSPAMGPPSPAIADGGLMLECPPGFSLAGPTRSAQRRLTLPAEFWDARPVLKHIRAAAHARIVSADVVLYSTLARLAALYPHEVHLDTGVGSTDGSGNVFVAVIGPSGTGKTSGVGVAKRLLGRPPWLAADDFADNVPLGSGEGLAEAFMGTRAVPKLDVDGQPIVQTDGALKTTQVRCQTRHNALFTADEGEVLAKMLERSGATIGETLRRAWVGETIGQANGRAETTRVINEGTYSLGLIIGFQLETALGLFSETALGTPQRFLWAWAQDDSIPDEDVPDPGALDGVWPAGSPPNDWIIGIQEPADLRQVTYPLSVRQGLRDERRKHQRGELDIPPLDAHRSYHLAKISAALAQLDGRRAVDDEDWRLAGLVWQTSCAVRDHVLAAGEEEAKKARAGKRLLNQQDAGDAERARAQVAESLDEVKVGKAAVWATRYVKEHGAMEPSRLRRVCGRLHPYLADALSLAVANRWLAVDDSGAYRLAEVRI